MEKNSESKSSEDSEQKASMDTSKTGPQTQEPKLSFIKPAPADHPIYKRGFVFGRVNSRP